MKRCSKCRKELGEEMFNKNKSKPDGLSTECKACVKEAAKKRYWENREESLAKSKREYQENKELRCKKQLDYYYANKAACNERMKERNKVRRKIDPLFLLKGRLRVRFRHVLVQKNLDKRASVLTLLGCSIEELYAHLGPKPTEDAQIDHIIPLAFAKSEEDTHKLWNYRNLQWLSREDNLNKKAAMPDGCEELLHSLGFAASQCIEINKDKG
jgi:hypothetical protein